MGIRSFLAFELPPEIRAQIGRVSEELQGLNMPVRWVKLENIHLTVVFLGSVREDTIEDIQEKVASVVKGFSTIKAGIKGMGAFPNWRRPRVIWVGLNGDIAGLSALRDALQGELEVFGVKPEKRPFRPHLTLGRFKGLPEGDEELKWILEKYRDMSSEFFPLHDLVLFKSNLKPDGPVYTKIKWWPLSAA